MVGEVLDLLRRHEAKATFMIISDFLLEDQARQVLADGHELGNHMPEDRPYDFFPPQDFEDQLLRANRALEAVLPQGGRIRWFRSPQGRYTRAMSDAVSRQSMRHVLGDSYCNDFGVDDPVWIADTLLRQVSSGSIIILHMPERGHWEHTFEALQILLDGLTARGLRAVTMSTLADLAEDRASLT
eukprot:gnl/TRDRNA2_/TRDRNA2_77567_c0_seq1.p1 gnl/TRDRNA2_/TRDRNA2_77567_c0~~gnl/TRDRNA2_/TRDRNA2_77567_c0_seq1.p1  ORF type:complete len:185 (+),score=19.03 gnl/TRDRNA2_/TRDRNA2_77567_c0_seq1:3-557(+)